MSETAEQRVRDAALLARAASTVEPLNGGVSNASFAVKDDTGTYVARVGQDYPVHHVFRARELARHAAAHAAGLSPEVVYTEPGIMVCAFIEAQTYSETDVRAESGALRRDRQALPPRTAAQA